MPDIFDTIELEERPGRQAVAQGDIFDQVAGPESAGDIFDEVAGEESPGLVQRMKDVFRRKSEQPTYGSTSSPEVPGPDVLDEGTITAGRTDLRGQPVAPGMPTSREEVQPTYSENAVDVFVKPMLRAPVETARAAAFLGMAIAPEESDERLGAFIDKASETLTRMHPDKDASFLTKFAGGLTGLAPFLATGGAGAAALLANSASRGVDAIDQGIDPKTATALAVKDLATTAAFFRLPMAGKTLPGGIARGVTGNLGLDIASKAVEKGILTAADYDELAEQVKLVDPESLAQAAGMGAVFGAHATMGARGYRSKTEQAVDEHFRAKGQPTPKEAPAEQPEVTQPVEGPLSSPKEGEGRTEGFPWEKPRSEWAVKEPPSPADIVRSDVETELSPEGISPEAIGRISERRLPRAFDAGMPKFYKAELYDRYMDRMWQYSQDSGKPISRSHLDIGFMKGMNNTYGHDRTNDFIKDITGIIHDTYANEFGIKDARFSRTGGDEMSIESLDYPASTLDAAAKSAKIKVEDYARRNGLVDIKDKDGNVGSVTLHNYSADSAPFSSVKDFKQNVDAKYAKNRIAGKEAPDVTRRGIETSRTVAPEGRQAGLDERTRQDNRGYREQAAEETREVAPPEPAPKHPESDLLNYIRQRVESGQPGERGPIDYEHPDPDKRGKPAWFSKSTYPDWFKGMKRADVLPLLDKALTGKNLTEVQQEKLDHLINSARPEYEREQARPAEGVRGAVKRLQEARAEKAQPIQEGFDLGIKGKDLRAPEREGKAVSMEETELGKATKEAKDRESQQELYAFPGGMGKRTGKIVGKAMVKFFDWAGEHIDPEWKAQFAKFFRTPSAYVEEHPEAEALFDRNIERGENRHRDGRFIFEADPDAGYSGIEPMLKLRGAEVKELSRILVDGDRQKARFTTEQLKAKYNASDRVMKAYEAARDMTERLQAVIIERTKEIALAPYETDAPLHDKLTRVANDLTEIRDKGEREKYMSRLSHEQASVLDATAQNALNRLQKYFDLIHDYMGIFDENPGYIPRVREEGAYHVRAFEKVLSDAERSSLFGIISYGRKARKRFTPEEAKEKFKIADKVVEAYRQALEKIDEDPVLTRSWGTDTEARKSIARIVDSVARREVWMEPVSTSASAAKLKFKAQAEPRKYFPENFKEGAEYEVSVKKNDPVPEEVYADIGNPAAREAILERSIRLAERRGEISTTDAEAISDSLMTVLNEEVAKRGAGRSFIRRQEGLIEGYKAKDMDKVLISHVTGMAGWLNKALYSVRALRDMKDIKDRGVTRWANEYYKDSLKNAGKMDEAIARARGAAVFWRLGNVLKTMVNNSFQQIMTGWGEMSRFTKAPGKILAQAEKDVLSGNLTEFDRKVLDEAIESGLSAAQYMRSITGAADTAPGRGFSRLVDISMKGFGLVESEMNRKPAYLAAMRLFTGQVNPKTGKPYGLDMDGKPYHLSYNEAMKRAKRFVRASHYEISRANEPEFVRKLGPIGHGLYTFQSFTANYLNTVFNRARHGEVRPLARYILATWALGGAAAFPFLDEIDAWLTKTFGVSVKRKLRFMVRHFLKRQGVEGGTAQTLEDLAMNGIPAAVAGVDMSRSVQVNTPLPIALILDTDRDLGEKAGGAIGGLVVSAGRAAGAAASGDYKKAVEHALPGFLSYPLKGYRQATEGATTASGRAIYDEMGEQLKYTPGEAVRKGLGFHPLRAAKYGEVNRYERGVKEYWQGRKEKLLRRARNADTDKDLDRVMDDIDAFNDELIASDALDIVPPITGRTMRYGLQDRPNRGRMQFTEEYLRGE